MRLPGFSPQRMMGSVLLMLLKPLGRMLPLIMSVLA